MHFQILRKAKNLLGRSENMFCDFMSDFLEKYCLLKQALLQAFKNIFNY